MIVCFRRREKLKIDSEGGSLIRASDSGGDEGRGEGGGGMGGGVGG